MILEVNSTKTFDEYLTEHPNLYDGVVGYKWYTDGVSWEKTDVSPLTKELIYDWFCMRNVCDDKKFGVMFKRKMNTCALRYAQMLRIELSGFDPLVADYVERQTIESNTKTSTGESNHKASGTTGQDGRDNTVRTPDLRDTHSNTRTPNLTDTHSSTRTQDLTDGHSSTRTPDLTDRETGETSGSNSTTHGGTDVTTDNGTAKGVHKEMSKQAPQSISYGGGGGGSLPNLDWTYATTQGQSEDVSADNKTSTTQYGATENGTNSGRNSTTTTHTGNERTVGQDTHTGTEKNVGEDNYKGTEKSAGEDTHTGTETTSHTQHMEGTHSDIGSDTTSSNEIGTGDRKEIASGRGGLTPQEAFSKAMTYLKTSSAFTWLRWELEDCFLSVYDI